MTNTALFTSMIDKYNRASYTHEYILGFTFNGLVYMTQTDASVLPSVLCLDRASRSAGCAIRFCPTRDQKIFLLGSAKVLCSVKYFETACAESIYNRGEVFEKLVTESIGQDWTKDNIPFTKAGDIEVNGIAYQIKFQRATFASEKTLARIEA